MGKPCLLPNELTDHVPALQQIPEELLTTPERYAVHLAALNQDKGTAALDFKRVAELVNERFSLTGEAALKHQHINRILKSDAMGIATDLMQDALQQQRDQETPPIAPQETGATSLPDTMQRPGLVRALLQVAEFAAYVRGDKTLSADLEALNRRSGGEGYRNPLIATVEDTTARHQEFEEWLEESLTKHNDAMRSLPEAVRATVGQGVETVQQAVTRKGIQDKAALQAATQPAVDAWHSMTATVQEKASTVSTFFTSAWQIGKAAVTVFQEQQKETTPQGDMEVMQQLRAAIRDRE